MVITVSELGSTAYIPIPESLLTVHNKTVQQSIKDHKKVHNFCLLLWYLRIPFTNVKQSIKVHKHIQINAVYCVHIFIFSLASWAARRSGNVRFADVEASFG